MHRILAADTSTTINTVAVSEGDCLLAEVVVEAGRRHAERLLATVDWVLSEAGRRLDQMDALAISVGPGSFTGLRVGVATWKGLALASGLPLIAVPTLDAMARPWEMCHGAVCPLLDAKMGEVYGAIYQFDRGVRTKRAGDYVGPVEPLLDGIEGEAWFLGPGAVRYEKRIREKLAGARFAPQWVGACRAGAVAAEALELIQQGVVMDAAVAPVYLRKSQAEVARDKRLAGAPQS